MQRISKIPFGITTFVVVALIMYATLDPNPLPDTEIRLFEGADKVIHTIMFLTLSLALSFDYNKKLFGKYNNITVAIVVGLFSTIFGIAIEFMQDAMAMGRTADIYDAIADAFGAFIGSFVWIPLCKHIFQNK
ncbi:MAG: VanZ family protein [Muribaculaceae bacterium]|nr:VanZ family protein [Muribaculaceae bacterium]